MADVFGTDSKLAGVFKGTTFRLTLGGGSGSLEGALVQQVQIQYERQLTRIWELGSRNQYYVEGRTQGQGSLQQIVGPKGIVTGLLSELSDICKATSRALTLTAGNRAGSCGVEAEATMQLAGPVATSVSMGANSAEFVVNSGLVLMFTGMSL
jgi:hypothetical protein